MLELLFSVADASEDTVLCRWGSCGMERCVGRLVVGEYGGRDSDDLRIVCWMAEGT